MSTGNRKGLKPRLGTGFLILFFIAFGSHLIIPYIVPLGIGFLVLLILGLAYWWFVGRWE